jgi:hypothetical protein
MLKPTTNPRTDVNVDDIEMDSEVYWSTRTTPAESTPMKMTAGKIKSATLPVTRSGYGSFLLANGSSWT